jgi:hypothetical protein
MDAGLDAELRGAERLRVGDALSELLARVLVGVGRAPALAEAAERAADDADVGDVDVAVDDEGDALARQLRAQLVGRGAHVLDRLGARLGEHRGDLLRRERRAVARPGDRGGVQVGSRARAAA